MAFSEYLQLDRMAHWPRFLRHPVDGSTIAYLLFHGWRHGHAYFVDEPTAGEHYTSAVADDTGGDGDDDDGNVDGGDKDAGVEFICWCGVTSTTTTTCLLYTSPSPRD